MRQTIPESKTNGLDKNLHLSGRNIARVAVLPASQMNAYDLLRRKRLVISKEALVELAAKAKAEHAARGERAAKAAPAAGKGA